MDLQIRKIQFVLDFLKINNEEIIDRLEKMLEGEKSKLYSVELDPLTINELNEIIDKAEEDSKMNRVKSVYALKKDINSWR